MATGAQYYRSRAHYAHSPFPAGHHLYALATPWPPQHHEPNHGSYNGPSPAPFLDYSQPGVDSGSLHPPAAALPSWPNGYGRPELHAWDHHPAQQHADQQDHAQQPFARPPPPAPAPYAAAQSSTPVPLANPHAAAPYQHHQVETSAQAVPQLSRAEDQTTPLLTTAPQAPLQPSASWQPHQQFSAQPSNTIPASVLPKVQTNSSASPWPVADPAEPAATTPSYERQSNLGQSNLGQDWPLVQPQPDRGAFAQHQPSMDHFDSPLAQLAGPPRSAPAKKKAAKVPSSFVERQEKLKVSKRKGPLQEKQREKTHTMRKTKRICVRCRFYKSGCDEGDPCEKCDKITGHARSFREPCYREHLEDTSLVRRCNGREHQEEAEFLAYAWIHNSQLYEMEILWNLPGYGPIPNAQPMRITFRPYSPRRGSLDVAASVWSNKKGEVRQLEQPAYAIYDTANLVPAFERYFSSLQPAIEDWIFARIRQDEVASLTYQEVVRMRSANGSKALDLAMRLQCLSVVSQGYGSVWSDHIPGIREYDYRSLGRSDYEAYDRNSRDRPLPGAITHQMDVAAVKYLGKLEKAFVKELAALIFKPKIKPWYELFLAFYVIFWNLEYIHHGAQDYIKSKNGTLIENQVSNVVTTQIKKWEFAFPVLLYHWRCTLRGYSPFRLARDNPEELRDRGHMDPEGFEYATKIAKFFDRINPDRFQPPLTGFSATHWSMSSAWILKLFKEAGA